MHYTFVRFVGRMSMLRFTSSLLSFFISSLRSFFPSFYIVIVLYRVWLKRLLICSFWIFLNPDSMLRSHSRWDSQIQVQLRFFTVHFIKFDFRVRVKSPKFSSWNSRSFKFLTIDICKLLGSSVVGQFVVWRLVWRLSLSGESGST